jgi:photosystem II stability/assembly factor-like uncharacterized protein
VGTAAVAAAGVVIALAALLGRGSGDGLVAVDSVLYQFPDNHLHGIGYDNVQGQLYIATHYGLFVMRPDPALPRGWGLYQLGERRDDFMGFTLHPGDPQVLFTSGHPQHGGNLGVLRSRDGGRTFERVFDGPEGVPIDFHSMTISAKDPPAIYGYYYGDERIYRSRDGGESWEWFEPEGLGRRGLCWAAPCLAGDPNDADTVYAGAQAGLMVSRDGGRRWEALAPGLGGPIAGVGVHPAVPGRMFAMKPGAGVLVSDDGGATWQASNAGLGLAEHEPVFAFAFDATDPNRVFLATMGTRIFESADGGRSWRQILP